MTDMLVGEQFKRNVKQQMGVAIKNFEHQLQ